MSEATIAKRKGGALALMADRCSVEPAKLHSTLKNTVFKGASDDELLALVVTANQYQLNPLLKEMYAFPQKGGGIVPLVSIDGWLKIINRQSNMDGMLVRVFPEKGEPSHAECKIFLKDRQHPVTVTEYFEECRRPTEPWKTMPRRMLRHKAIIQCARVAFGIAGIHDEDEAADITGGFQTAKVVADAEVSDVQPEWHPLRDDILKTLEPNGVSEAEFVGHLREIGQLDEGVRDLDEACQFFGERMEALKSTMPTILDAIIAEREANEPPVKGKGAK